MFGKSFHDCYEPLADGQSKNKRLLLIVPNYSLDKYETLIYLVRSIGD